MQLLYNFLQVLCEMEEHRIPLISRHLLAHGEELVFFALWIRSIAREDSLIVDILGHHVLPKCSFIVSLLSFASEIFYEKESYHRYFKVYKKIKRISK